MKRLKCNTGDEGVTGNDRCPGSDRKFIGRCESNEVIVVRAESAH
ncbi:hypothetical protein [Allorhodopirellula heiligendammensis]|nr:hypothetical protein [Allorhodopirellula heiligendammensis]